MSSAAVTAYVEGYVPEDEPLLMARQAASDIGGAPPISPSVGAALRFLAAAIGARAVVEIGTGCGTSGIWLLRGMRPDAVLTSVDTEPDHQRLAREAFSAAGLAGRCRLISGRAAGVLPRLTDGAYDMVFCDADKQEYPAYLEEALRLLRPGGVVAFDNALWGGAVAAPEDADAGPRGADPDTDAIKRLCEQVREDDRLAPVLLPIGDGLLAAVKLAA